MKSEMTELPPNQNRQSTIQIRMVDLNLFRVFDAMMLHRSVRKASQMLSVTPSAYFDDFTTSKPACPHRGQAIVSNRVALVMVAFIV